MTIVGSMHCAHLQEKLKLLLQSILPARYQALRKVFRRAWYPKAELGSYHEVSGLDQGLGARLGAGIFPFFSSISPTSAPSL